MVAAPFSSWLSVVFNNANWVLTKIILGAVHLFAQLPGGHVYLEHLHRPSGARLEINVLDLKSGAAVHLRTGNGDWLFDAGSVRDYDRVLRQYLRSRGVNRLDGVVLTHGDAAHLGGAEGVLLDFRPRQLIESAAPDRSPLQRKLLAQIVRQGSTRRLCQGGDEFNLAGDVTARVLFPPAGFESGRADDRTLVVQLMVSGKACALFMSDSGLATEARLMQMYPDLRSDVLIKGQHHSGFSGSDAFLQRVQPQAIVATARDFPESERIKPEWAEGLQARGIKLFRLDETGAVQIRIFGSCWEAKGYVTSESFRSTSR
jgi:competence protein ComEC